MRPVLFLLLLAPLALPSASADGGGACTQLGCVRYDDRDGDGRADWANAALAAPEEVAEARLALDGWIVDADGTVGTPHGLAEPGWFSTFDATANLTGSGGGPGFGSLAAQAGAYAFDEETGETDELAFAYASVS